MKHTASTYKAPNIFRRIRNETSLSQQAFSKELGTSPSTIAFLEIGCHTPSAKTVKLFCQYLVKHPEIGITPIDFVEKL